MRSVVRPALPAATQAFLDRRQTAADRDARKGTLNIERRWKTARQTKTMARALQVLRQMMGPRERCMYCVDSHGCDIEHFRPKSSHPTHAFQWPNLLLCCPECGRFKGLQFPTENGRPLLIDPSAEDPWQHLDFDPETGGLTARFDVQTNDWSRKGAKTVEVLRLDRREALGNVYKATFGRLCRIVQTWPLWRALHKGRLRVPVNGRLGATQLAIAGSRLPGITSRSLGQQAAVHGYRQSAAIGPVADRTNIVMRGAPSRRRAAVPYAAGGATDTPRTACLAISCATSPVRICATNSLKYAVAALR